MTPIEHMRKAITMFEATGQVGELSRAQAWATIVIAEHMERTCQPQATPPAAATADATNNSAKRGRRTSQPAKSPAAAAPTSSNQANHGTSITLTTGSATSALHTSDATK